MSRLFFMVMIWMFWLLLLPSVAGCARAGNGNVRRRADAGLHSVATNDASVYVMDAPTMPTPRDASVSTEFTGEVCNGFDDDRDGLIDEGCSTNPASNPSTCHEETRRIRISLDATRLGACADGWTIVLWGSGGALEEYRSLPGEALEVFTRDDWAGWAAFTIMCGDWSRVRDWSAYEGHDVRDLGVTVIMNDETAVTHVCFDPGGHLIRPLIPIECGLPDCPGRTY